MRTRFKIISSLSLLAILLTGCNFFGGGGSDNPPVTKDSYTITWKNYDGSILEIDEKVSSGSMPSYDGNTPIKISTQQFSYTFSGWSPSIKMVTGDVTYVAQFSETVNTYTITWDIEGVKTTEVYNYGEMPSYKNGTPTKASTEQYSYSFSGWSPEITSVTADKTYIAQYNQLVNSYTITFVTNGGDPISPLSGEYGDPVVIPTPTKGNFFFVGWFIDESLTNKANISTMPGENITLYAKWSEMYTVFEMDSKQYMYFGSYPQSVVVDENLISELSKITTTNSRGYYEYAGNEYAKKQVNAYISSYTYANGSSVTDGKIGYFKVEPILWRVLASDTSGNYTLLAEQALYAHEYNDYNSYSNNYKESSIRDWMNNDFFNAAFKSAEKDAILTTNVDNSASTTNSTTNPYICENTDDKVFLLSYKDYLNPDYGFSSSYTSYDSARYCKPTDYAIANHCYMHQGGSDDRNCDYWTRSPDSDYSDFAWCVDSDGPLFSDDVSYDICGVRPALVVKNVSIDPTQDEEWNKGHGVIPVVNTTNNTLTYGLYPQTHVNDSSLITILNSLTDPEDNGFFFYDQEYYTKLVAHPCSSDYKFDDGTTIVSGTTYWFKCEPIVWDILKNDNGDYFLFSDVLLDAHRYDDDKNNYVNSEIRSWLNGEFYNKAFFLNDSYINVTNVDNSISSTFYSSNPNTDDKIFLLSFKEITTEEYGFSSSYSTYDVARRKRTSDYARANYCWYSTSADYLFNGYYWTRSPIYNYSYYARYVGSDGYVVSNYVDDARIGVCPALNITIVE